jgi:hypothetical protein
VAAKMLMARWIDIPVTWSLAIMAVILGVCAAASIAKGTGIRDQGSGIKK